MRRAFLLHLSDIGIRVNLQKIAYATQRQMLDQSNFDMNIGVWSPDYADPYMFMNYWFDSKNFGLAGNRAFIRALIMSSTSSC